MNKMKKTIFLVTVLTGFSAISYGWRTGSFDSAGQAYWRIRNNSNNPLEIKSDVDSLRLPPGTDGTLTRGSNFTLWVINQSTGMQQQFYSTDHVIVFFNDNGNLAIATHGAWVGGVGFRFGRFGVDIGVGPLRGWWGRRGGRGGGGWWGGRRGWRGRGRRPRRR